MAHLKLNCCLIGQYAQSLPLTRHPLVFEIDEAGSVVPESVEGTIEQSQTTTGGVDLQTV